MKTCCRKELEDDKDLKELMLARLVTDQEFKGKFSVLLFHRYAFVDDDDEGKVTHRPVLPKTVS